MMGRWLRDVRYAVRSLRREPVFALVAAGSLAVGIGANTAVFSVADAVLLRPLPGIPTYDRVVELGRSHRGEGFDTFAYPDFLDLRESVPALEEAAAFSLEILSVARDGAGIRANGQLVSPAYFRVLGLEPERGRFFTPDEDAGVGEHPVAVVTHRFWEREMGADPGALGSTVSVNRVAYTVVGVTPQDFRGHMIGLEPDIYMPMAQAPVMKGRNDLDNRGASWHMALGLLAEGATLEQLQEQLAALGTALAEAHPRTNQARSFRAQPLGPVPAGGRGGIRLFVTALLGMVALILLVTCTNVAGMFLARALSREREVAVRRALGAGRGALARQLTVETLLVFLLGGGAGIWLGAWAVTLLRPDLLPVPVPVHFDLGARPEVLAVSLGVTLLAGLLFGLLPAAQASRTDLVRSLRSESGTGGRGTGRLRTIFAGAQVGLSLVLLATAGLFLRSLQRASVVETGFDPTGAYTTYLDLSLEGYDTAEGRVFQADLLASLRSLGWVTGASLSTDLPLDLSRSSTGVFPAGWDDAEDQRALGVDFNRVSDGYFETLGIPVLQGRPFAPSDREGNAPVVIVSRAFVEAAWSGGEPLGRTIQIGRGGDARVLEVVGVVEDVKNQLITDEATPFLYLPIGQDYGAAVQVVVRTSLERARAVPDLRAAILEMDPSLSLGSVVSLERFTSVGILPQRIAAALTSALGLLALLLSGLGIYGVISFAVGRRRREIGIRMALGESRRSVIARFVRSGLGVALPGMLVGGILALLGGRVLRALLLDLSPHDPVALGGVSLLLLGVVVVATWLPARRAARVDPARSLRVEQ